MGVEIEAKMRVDGFGDVRAQLAAAGARRLGTVLETNTFFDTADRTLLAGDQGLRLRRSRTLDRANDAAESFLVTFKGPQQPGSQLKSREELEVGVTDGAAAVGILAALGYRPTHSFEKRRESWELASCKVELDELPQLGMFVEIEGPDQAAVLDVRGRLGLSQHPLIRTGYVSMVADHLAQSNDVERALRFG